MKLKFRAWDKFDKCIYEVHGIDFDTEVIWINETFNPEDVAYSREFDEVILMQSTGLYDIKGNEIYEGDILLSHQNNSVGKVYWNVHDTGFYRSVKREGMGLFDSFTLFRSKHNLEIIGNIYENAELLEATE